MMSTEESSFPFTDMIQFLLLSCFIWFLSQLLAFMVLESASAVSKDLILQKPEARDNEFPRFGLLMNLTKEMVNSRLLVAAVAAAMTFTAGFTVPRGVEMAFTSERHMATILDNRWLQVFTICNTIAMFSSMIAVVNLKTAQQSDSCKARTAFRRTTPLLTIAVLAMSVAFLTGVTLAVGKLLCLAFTIYYCLGIFGLSAKLLEYPYFYRGDCRPIRLLTSWLLLVCIYLWGVDTEISDDLGDKTSGNSISVPPEGAGEANDCWLLFCNLFD